MDIFSNDEVLAELLNSNVNSATETAFGVRKDNYRQLVALGNVTSYSMQEVLHACARKFQLLKLQADNEGEREFEANVDFAFGHAVGAGVAVFDETKDLNKAVWAAFLAWNIDLFAESQKKANRPDPKKSFHHAIWALYVYSNFVEEDTDLADYEVVKTEANIAVDLENGYFYVGHIDQLLKNKYTGKFRVKENKTTSYSTVDPAMYANSDQALSYAVVVDSLGDAEYEVLYTVYSSTEQRWMQFLFVKSPLSKIEWLQDQAITASTIDLYAEKNFFPKRGSSCLAFGRRCEHFETCDFDSERVFGKKFNQLKRVQSLVELQEIELSDFAFKWSDIVKRQRERLNEA